MINIIFGNDSFQTINQLSKLLNSFSQKNKEVNFEIFDFSEKQYTLERISAALLSTPFLTEKRVIVLKYFLTRGGILVEKVAKYFAKLPNSTELVIFDGVLRKRPAWFAKGNYKIQECKELFKVEMQKWLQTKLLELNIRLTQPAFNLLIDNVKGNLWKASNELEKLSAYYLDNSGVVVSEDDLSVFIRPQVENNIFNMLDYLGERDVKRAFREAEKVLSVGEGELYIISMVAYQFRNLLIINDLSRLSAKEIANISGLHPYVISKLTRQARDYSYENLRKIYGFIIGAERSIKTGMLLPKIALEILFLEIARV